MKKLSTNKGLRVAVAGVALVAAGSLALPLAARAAPPPVVRAVLHPDGAVVTRLAQASCADGAARVAFKIGRAHV